MSVLATAGKRIALSMGLGLGLSALGFFLLEIAAKGCGPTGIIALLGSFLNLYHLLLWSVVVPMDSIDQMASPILRTLVILALPAVDWSLFFLGALSLGRSSHPPAEVDEEQAG